MPIMSSGVAGPLAARGGGQICRPFVMCDVMLPKKRTMAPKLHISNTSMQPLNIKVNAFIKIFRFQHNSFLISGKKNR